MKEEDIKKMVNNFLVWKLPADFSPDGSIYYSPMERFQPIGTNLFTAQQAREMIEFITKDLN